MLASHTNLELLVGQVQQESGLRQCHTHGAKQVAYVTVMHALLELLARRYAATVQP